MVGRTGQGLDRVGGVSVFFLCVCVCMCVVVPLSHDVLLLLCVSVEQASTVCGLDCAKAQEWCTGNQFQLL